MNSSILTESEVTFSALTFVTAGLALYALVLFIKMIIQFGLPNHPLRLSAYLVSLCVVVFFGGKALVGMGFLSPFLWVKYRPLPMVAGSLALLLQVIIFVGSFSLLQQKIITRIPLLGALLCLAFFPNQAEVFIIGTLIAGCIFLSVSVGKARYQRRQFFKICLFVLITTILRYVNIYWFYVVGEALLAFAVFYFFIFQQSACVSALVDDHLQKTQEGSR